MEEIGYALGYDWDPSSRSTQKLKDLLKTRCETLEINGLDEYLQDFEYATANSEDVRTYFHVFINMFSLFPMFGKQILAEPWHIDSKHFQYYKILFRKSRMDGTASLLFGAYGTLMFSLYQLVVFNRETLNDQVKLNELDRKYIDLHECHEYHFNFHTYNMSWDSVMYVFILRLLNESIMLCLFYREIISIDTRKTEELLNSITTPEDT